MVGWQPQEETIMQKIGGWSKLRAKEIAKSLKGLRKIQKTIKKDKGHKGRVPPHIRKEKKEDKKKFEEEIMSLEEEDVIESNAEKIKQTKVIE